MHWFIVVSQKEARIFIKSKERTKIELVKTFKNPLSSEKRRALVRKEAGRNVKSFGRGTAIHYSQPRPHDPREEATLQFAKKLSSFLESEKNKKSFRTLTIFAEPHLLGMLRKEMSGGLRMCVTHWVHKDLQKTPKKRLADFVSASEAR